MSGEKSPARTGRLSLIRVPLFLMLLSLLAAGCQPSSTPSPQPTPRVLALQVTSSLLPLQTFFKQCSVEQENFGLAIIQSTTSAIEIEQGGVALRWGMNKPPDGYAAVLGQEELVIVVHPLNPIQQISVEDLRAVYSGSLSHWPGSDPEETIQPWVYPSTEDIQEIFTDALLQAALPAQSAVSIAPDPQAVLEVVGNNPEAIGFLPRRWLTGQVKEIAVQGLEPAGVRRPVIALSKFEPDGLHKQWLACLQEKLAE